MNLLRLAVVSFLAVPLRLPAAEPAPSLVITLPRDPAGFDWQAVAAFTRDCWAEICARLPEGPVEIRFNHLPHLIVPEVGVGGYCPSDRLIYVTLAPDRADWRRNLRRALAHESHHCARWRTVGYGRTLGEALVTEGLADHFVAELCGGPADPWTRALTEAELATVRVRALPLLGGPDDHKAWFFGSSEQKLPRWTGYALGYRLVAEYLARHPAARASGLVATPADEILGSLATH